ncbi:MAG: cytochrome c3 family protein [Thermoanaerobaculia bacterium]
MLDKPVPRAASRFVTAVWIAALSLAALAAAPVFAQSAADCLACHNDNELVTERNGRPLSLFVPEKSFAGSVHASMDCIGCHEDVAGAEGGHDTPLKKVNCGSCHEDQVKQNAASFHGRAMKRSGAAGCVACHGKHDIRSKVVNCSSCHDAQVKQHAASLHGQAVKRGDPLAPTCASCHGGHDIRPASDPASTVSPLRVPYTCGKCHQEGTKVMTERNIHQDRILENYSESIHGEGLLKKGLIVSANCASCHTAHNILAHTDPKSSIARQNIARTCTQCHAQIEAVHRKVIRGELWEKESHILPACVDCHQPHKVRKVFYTQGMANADCLRCHEKKDLLAKDGRTMFVDAKVHQNSRHVKVSCAQCHSGVNVSLVRPCESITRPVDCGACHPSQAQEYARSQHGKLLLKGDSNAPSCKECHGTHGILGKLQTASLTFPTNVPLLCARCHREGQKAAVRYKGTQHQIIESYTDSIHGKGLLKSGLTVTATCTNCHTAHGVLPKTDPASSVNRTNVPETCGKCHHGIEEKFSKSIHATMVGKTDKPLPVCNDCHTAHTIRRADAEGFKLDIMEKCGRCHGEIAKTYFDTYHGKVSQLGSTKTAKCYDCHGAHDILPVSDPRSHLSRGNVVQTCKKCHAGATRRFAGYLSHATHHDPKKYPWLFWSFWGMTGLLVGTFAIGGAHTLLWLPRAFQMRKELIAEEEAEERAYEEDLRAAHEADRRKDDETNPEERG